VTVYERDERIGGLLRYGIPDFRLEKWVLDRRLEQLRAEGVRFRANTRVGVDLDAAALLGSVDAVVLACGSTEPRDLRVKGRDLAGVHFALDYLSQQNRWVAGAGFDGDTRIDAAGLDVVVIGGGDTGSDCVGTAIRQGARSVTQIQYHQEPPPRGDVLLTGSSFQMSRLYVDRWCGRSEKRPLGAVEDAHAHPGAPGSRIGGGGALLGLAGSRGSPRPSSRGRGHCGSRR
jgi:NADPH-dependent glutamate synthase beta subunit-like oxidoreductase